MDLKVDEAEGERAQRSSDSVATYRGEDFVAVGIDLYIGLP